jgi:hypothetical protein
MTRATLVNMESVTWGLDVSTSKGKTAAVEIRWGHGEARVISVVTPLAGGDIPALINDHSTKRWAVDVPFGWPDKFVELMHRRHENPLAKELIPAPADRERWRTREVAQRLTDRFLTDDPRIATRPLPASFQLLGATAAMWVLIEAELSRLGVSIDRAGMDGHVCETYPSAALSAWGAKKRRGKHTYAMLQQRFPFLTADDHLVRTFASDDVCNAIVCGLVARARDLNLTIGPRSADELAVASREGWIHVSCEPAGRLLSG